MNRGSMRASITTKLVLCALVVLGLLEVGSTAYFIRSEEDVSDRTFTDGAQAYVSNLASSINLATRSSADEPEAILASPLLGQFAEVARFNRDVAFVAFLDENMRPLAGHPQDLDLGPSAGYLHGALAGPLRVRSRPGSFAGRPVLEVTAPLLVKGSVVGLVHAGFSTERLAAAKERVRRQAVLYAALAFLAATVVFTLFARHLTAPLASLSDVVGRVAAGDLAARARTDRADEIGALARSVNDMTEALEGTIAALEASEARYRSLFENAPEGVFRADPFFTFIIVNPALARLLRMPREELAGRGLLEFCPDADARRAFAEATTREGTDEGVELPLVSAGGARVVASVRVRAVRDAEGGVQHYEGTVEDITEKRELERRLLHAEKMTAIGTLASGIAHDFNNLLTVIVGFSSYLLGHMAPEDRHYGRVRRIEEAGRRGADLTRRLLDFSRNAPTEARAVDLNEIVGETVPLLRQTIGANVEIVVEAGPDLPKVGADPGQLHQVIINLAVNARDAMPEGGRLTVRTDMARFEPGDAHVYGDAAPGEYVRLLVEDTGTGIPAANEARVFDPFFTTKPTGSGTGLGLSIVYGIVKSHHGFIALHSGPGGTRFELYFPAAASLEATRA